MGVEKPSEELRGQLTGNTGSAAEQNPPKPLWSWHEQNVWNFLVLQGSQWTE